MGLGIGIQNPQRRPLFSPRQLADADIDSAGVASVDGAEIESNRLPAWLKPAGERIVDALVNHGRSDSVHRDQTIKRLYQRRVGLTTAILTNRHDEVLFRETGERRQTRANIAGVAIADNRDDDRIPWQDLVRRLRSGLVAQINSRHHVTTSPGAQL